MWMMLPPFFVVGTKIAEATNESTLIVTVYKIEIFLKKRKKIFSSNKIK